MSTVCDLKTGNTNAFWVRDGVIEFRSPEHKATAARVKNPGSFGAALARQGLAIGLWTLRRKLPACRVAGDVIDLCTHKCNVQVRLGGVPIGRAL